MTTIVSDIASHFLHLKRYVEEQIFCTANVASLLVERNPCACVYVERERERLRALVVTLYATAPCKIATVHVMLGEVVPYIKVFP